MAKANLTSKTFLCCRLANGNLAQESVICINYYIQHTVCSIHLHIPVLQTSERLKPVFKTHIILALTPYFIYPVLSQLLSSLRINCHVINYSVLFFSHITLVKHTKCHETSYFFLNNGKTHSLHTHCLRHLHQTQQHNATANLAGEVTVTKHSLFCGCS